jgi:hypothetical protein
MWRFVGLRNRRIGKEALVEMVEGGRWEGHLDEDKKAAQS